MSENAEQTKPEEYKGDTGETFSLPEEIDMPIATEDIQPEIKANVSGRQAALDALDFIRVECKDQLNDRFWEVIRDSAIAEVGFPLNVQAGKPMDNKQAKDFLESSVPYGKYLGMKVKTALKRDRKYLESLTTKPDRFQKALHRFLLWEQEFSKKLEVEKTPAK